ncbi:hypothetical protein [Streptomyces buecherae]|uniref:Guanylate cyclase domain-containing protein n=1 Tax=Streptomyces buecherae TaxID=2763006 RepID=A0A7H8NAH3_9ACTN|nr:hypothetical protein [Streptomyces buecherae]QKW51372.1 hypothetical protein HUT08_19590 [Streptomyces buecherae]
MDDDARDAAEARYELVISVDARRSGEYEDADKPSMRAQLYRVLEAAFRQAKVARDAVHLEDRGDGVLAAVASRVPVTRLLGLWLVEVHEHLRHENRGLSRPLGLRVGLHVGPVRHDERGISGRAVDLACRLADSPVARALLDAERADLVLVVSDALYEDVVRGGGKYIDAAHYTAARLRLKEGEVTAWFRLPGRPAPRVPATAEGPSAGGDAGGSPTGPTEATEAGDPADAQSTADATGPEHAYDDRKAGDGGAGDGEGAYGTGPSDVRYTVHGDLSNNWGNQYHQGVHIGRNAGDTGPRRG